jgi:diphthamide biosynthesis enzyme Dph1/Dph2-like protein
MKFFIRKSALCCTAFLKQRSVLCEKTRKKVLMDYDLQIDDAIAQIKEQRAKRVLIQLPDGLKQYAPKVREGILAACPDVQLAFWAGSGFGACDVPLHARSLGFDLLLSFGHAPWRN